jgi:Domain of unknown function (DUF4173)
MSQTAEQPIALPGIEKTILDQADLPVLAGVAAVGLATDLALRAGGLGLGGALLVAVATAALLASGRLATWSARLTVAAAPLFGAWLALRTSPWLIPLDLLAAAGLLAVGASLARGGSLTDLTIPRMVLRALHAGLHAVAAPAFVAGPLRAAGGQLVEGRHTRLATQVGWGLLLAVPVVVVLGMLLASADAVFASFFQIDIDLHLATVAEHGAALLAGAWAAAGLLRVTSVTPPGRLPGTRSPIGAVEAMVVLAGLCGLFATFAAAQLVALSRGGKHVLATAGLTYAEYARSGFFQLLAVAVITLGVLLALRAATDLGSPRRQLAFTVMAELAVALTLVVVVVAVRRLNLYEDAYGLTMLRLYSELFSYWIGVVFLLLAATLAGVWRGRAWFLGAAAATGLALLLALNVANPEAVVASDLLAGGHQVEREDPSYLALLSDDAAPTLVAGLAGQDLATRAELLAVVCRQGGEPVRFTGWAAWNLGAERADRARAKTCPDRP